MEDSQLPSQALSGFANGALYDQYRPSYPQASVHALLEALRVSGQNGATIVDLAAGTGKFTELLAKRDENYKILAVEPHEEMRKQLESKQLNNVAVEEGFATSIPVADESVDAVIAAQAFHWFANQEALQEIHRVLKPDGCFGMIWNIEDYNQAQNTTVTTGWESKMRDFTWSLDDSQPRFRHEKWRDCFESQLKSTPLTVTLFANPLFSLPLGEHENKWTVWLTKDALWERYRTLSQVAVLQGEALTHAENVFADALNGDDVERNEQGEIAMHGFTLSAWTSKIPATT
ncbi:S-adenosyl-L-methionine-dependent methyltransferase [Patellaria atrata CBS 101060]|uniref:S-adenosyl-L-methionine-dependent methyltransferase n=1 Tax=Patellaria atrata CBS 101060 TaxID=1346257 RepID=A0A9P4SI23_9PEZI|nr:S-adenosyl-L-methionine-dependent methyltransferase [Patellaria atrata CBS 101060]